MLQLIVNIVHLYTSDFIMFKVLIFALLLIVMGGKMELLHFSTKVFIVQFQTTHLTMLS